MSRNFTNGDIEKVLSLREHYPALKFFMGTEHLVIRTGSDRTVTLEWSFLDAPKWRDEIATKINELLEGE